MENSNAFPTRINIGCGFNKLAGYLNVDVDPSCSPDILVKDHDLSFLPQRAFKEVLAWDVLEHIPREFTMSALLDWASLLVDDGVLTLQTSHILGLAREMSRHPGFEGEYNWSKCLFGNQAHSGDFHFNGFTEATLWTHLKAAGFEAAAFTLTDGWLIGCQATKTSDWRDMVELETDSNDFLKASYLAILHRDADSGAIHHYNGRLSTKLEREQLVRNLLSSPENLYKIGATFISTNVSKSF